MEAKFINITNAGVLHIKRGDKFVMQKCIKPEIYNNRFEGSLGGDLPVLCSGDCPFIGEPYDDSLGRTGKFETLQFCCFRLTSKIPFYPSEKEENKDV